LEVLLYRSILVYISVANHGLDILIMMVYYSS